jgi:hypothetical protein
MNQTHGIYRIKKEDLEFIGRMTLLIVRVLYYLILIYSIQG